MRAARVGAELAENDWPPRGAARRDAPGPRTERARRGVARRGRGEWWRARSSDAQRGRPREAGVDPGVGVHAGLPRLRLLVVVVVLRVVMVVVVPVLLAARGQRVRRRALLPPVLRPVHLDLLLPALLAAERRVTSADRRTTYVKNNKNNKKKSCGGETSIVHGAATCT